MSIREFLTKLQNLPDQQKKIILWSVVAVLAIAMGAFWIRGAMNSLDKIGQSVGQIKLPEIQTSEIPNIQTSTDQTAGWKTYTNDEYGFEIKYPTDYKIAAGRITDQPEEYRITIFPVQNINQGNSIVVKIETGNVSLEENVIAAVAQLKKDSAQSAAPVVVNYGSYEIGGLRGYLITSKAADVPGNTYATFKIQKGENIIGFSYYYQGYILASNPEEVLAGVPVTKEFQDELQSKIENYNQIQRMLSTFKFLETK